jgi:alginate O-acetyltransferase complex protein AlgJ
MARSKSAYSTGMVIVVIFIASLWLPIIDNCFNIVPAITKNEKSKLSMLPELKPDPASVFIFYKMFIRNFIDNFGFRNSLIRANSLLKLKLLKVDEFPKVLIGKENWLYLIKDDDGNNALDYYRVTRPFTSDKELAEWTQPILDVERQCKKRGIKFIVAIAPMKTRVYPEYIPRYLEPLRKTTRLDQLKEYLGKHTDIDFVDMGEAVLEGKKKYIVFLKYDVHWNGYGAFFAYQMLTEKLAHFYPYIKPKTIDDYAPVSGVIPGGDLASMLGLKDMFSETAFVLKPKFNSRAKRGMILYPVKSSRLSDYFETGDRSLPRAIVFHDSFFNLMKLYLPEHFSRMACFQSYNRIDLSIINVEKPDVVIYEMSESFIQKSPAYVTPLSN